MKGNIQEKRPLVIFRVVFVLFFLLPSFMSFFVMCLEKLADQEFDAGDVPPHLEDRIVLLCVGKIKRVYRSRADMLLPNYTCVSERITAEIRGRRVHDS